VPEYYFLLGYNHFLIHTSFPIRYSLKFDAVWQGCPNAFGDGASASKYCISRKLPVKMNLQVVHMHLRLAVKGVVKDLLKKSRVVTGLLTENNTLRRHFYVMGLIYSPLWRRCGAQERTQPCVLLMISFGFTLTHLLGLIFLGR
jgi:hypothetical protein